MKWIKLQKHVCLFILLTLLKNTSNKDQGGEPKNISKGFFYTLFHGVFHYSTILFLRAWSKFITPRFSGGQKTFWNRHCHSLKFFKLLKNTYILTQKTYFFRGLGRHNFSNIPKYELILCAKKLQKSFEFKFSRA